jgi:hypothetical protein
MKSALAKESEIRTRSKVVQSAIRSTIHLKLTTDWHGLTLEITRESETFTLSKIRLR